MLRTLLLLISISITQVSLAAEPVKVDFARDVKPILSNTCFKCHGPATQKGGLRLDSLDTAKKGAIVPGKPDMSEMIKRVLSEDKEERMPPASAGDKLTPQQVKMLKDWIANGAEYTPHWSFRKPERAANHKSIDEFIIARLKTEGMQLSPEADRHTLIRRVTLDLTGLLPSPKEVDEFINDKSTNAYEKLVDRLLVSEHYGERQARHWLDLARYADSNGYTVDGARQIWPFRDWVIKAMNKDMPFSQFTIEQLAGDLLSKPTRDQLVATGFHRNTSYNEEGGTDPEQFRVERIVDRTNTTAAVWLGLTMNCCQCHDHKYDPVSQKDYYSLYAFFNTCDETSITIGGAPELEAQVNELMAKSIKLKSEGKLDEGKKVDAEIKKIQVKVPTTLVLRERKGGRETFVQIRGDFLRKGDAVKPAYPGVIASAKGGNRLDLAKWLVSRENPLTARVVVNRAWQQFFGRGIVETENDFGIQGKMPTHPELLDWLAVELQEPTVSGKTPWSMKQLHKLIVMSQTYRQSSNVTGTLTKKDPYNLYLARQSRIRLEAEIIRDAALSASGLLNPKIGGTGVYPPLPKEVFSFTQSNHPWPESKGPDRFRRGMYTFIWRQSQHHLLTTFDAADAQVACTKRNRSNTPLQALHLANDPAFIEFAQALGDRIDKEGKGDVNAKIAYAYQLCFARNPSNDETARIAAYYQHQAKADPKTAWARTARVLMNLDEFITRE